MTTLITGGSGFLGRAILKWGSDSDYIVYSRDEYKQDLCKRKIVSDKHIEYRIGDVKDLELLEWTLTRYQVETIIHAAAVKYIPEAEINAIECVSVNVDGSRNVARAAINCGVSNVVGISTDKAAMPVNVYGATKMLMERLFGEYALIAPGRTRFKLTRYGNVVGSTGSVIPLFEDQLCKYGKVKLTDPNMTRFWISIKKAVQLCELALKAENGHMIIPKASAMSMLDLALSVAGNKQRIEIIGAHPGEKQHEAMITSAESLRAVDCIDYYNVGSEFVGEGFVLTSNNPHVWIDESTMKNYIEMAKGI